MGLSADSFRCVLLAMESGLDLKSVCTLGRLVTSMRLPQIESLLRQHHRLPEDFRNVYPWRDPIPSADSLFRLLGATKVDSMDNSPYEGANVIHDLNVTIPESLHQQYDLVMDGGTLEHVFHFARGLENAMSMVKPGGHIILVKPANGLCGHGFYQLSPELFFRVMSPQHGFELLRLYLLMDGKAYHVVDPVQVHGRVEIRKGVCNVLVHARKIGSFTGFDCSPPQQSDYLTTWKGHEQKAKTANVDGRIKGMLRKHLSRSTIETISRWLNRIRQWRWVWQWKRGALISNRRFYLPVKRWEVLTREAIDKK